MSNELTPSPKQYEVTTEMKPKTATEEFLSRYGTETLGLMVKEFIKKAPEFSGDYDLAAEIGRAMGLLEGALEEAHERVYPNWKIEK